MKKIENDCIGCAVPLYPCRGDTCPLRQVPHYYCDKCGEEFEPEALYVVDDEDLCIDCLASGFPTVKECER